MPPRILCSLSISAISSHRWTQQFLPLVKFVTNNEFLAMSGLELATPYPISDMRILGMVVLLNELLGVACFGSELHLVVKHKFILNIIIFKPKYD